MCQPEFGYQAGKERTPLRGMLRLRQDLLTPICAAFFDTAVPGLWSKGFLHHPNRMGRDRSLHLQRMYGIFALRGGRGGASEASNNKATPISAQPSEGGVSIELSHHR